MKTKLFILLSHRINDEQLLLLIRMYGAIELIYLPENLQTTFSNVDPNLQSLKNISVEIISWLKTYPISLSDKVVLQGESGLCFILLQWLFKQNIEVIYSTTLRHCKEIKLANGSIELRHFIKPIQFRKYQNLNLL